MQEAQDRAAKMAKEQEEQAQKAAASAKEQVSCQLLSFLFMTKSRNDTKRVPFVWSQNIKDSLKTLSFAVVLLLLGGEGVALALRQLGS